MKNRMFQIVLILAFLLFIASISVSTQNKQNNQTRYSKQHPKRYNYMKDHLNQTEANLLQCLKNDNVSITTAAVQTIRVLEEIFPSESFNAYLDPLIAIVQNENADTQLRLLSAIALDKLHSDKGDMVIYMVAKNTTNESVKILSQSLAIESFKVDDWNRYPVISQKN